MADVTVRLDSREVERLLTAMVHRLGTLRSFFEATWPILHRSVMTNFRVGGRPARWQALAPATVKARQRKGTWRTGVGSDQPILQEYGQLRQSIGSVFRMTDTALEYGTNDRRAIWLQEGTSRMPARPFLLFQAEDVTQITAVAAAYAFGTRGMS